MGNLVDSRSDGVVVIGGSITGSSIGWVFRSRVTKRPRNRARWRNCCSRAATNLRSSVGCLTSECWITSR